MKEYEEKLKQYIADHKIDCEHLAFSQSCHSVADAAKATGASEDAFVKNICMIDSSGRLIVCIVKGEDRASTSRVAKALGIDRPRIAEPAEILEKSGYPCGGTPSFGYSAVFLIDERVLEKDIVYTGGGSAQSVVKISVNEMQRVNEGKVVRVRK